MGLGVVVAGVIIAVAGIFLTPMRGVVLHAMRNLLGGGARQPVTDTTAAQATAGETTDAPPAAPVTPLPAAPSANGKRAAAVAPAPAPAPIPKIALGPAEQRTANYREQEALFARTLLTAQKTAEDLVRNAQLEAEEITARAEASAAETTRASRKNAAEIVQKAERDADLIVASAKKKAAASLALLQVEADKLAAEANQAFQVAQRAVEQNVTTLSARLERRMAEWNGEPWERSAPAGGGDGLHREPWERAAAGGVDSAVDLHPSAEDQRHDPAAVR
ncbi:MAG TPA: DivIVA domain-containing protein [bacterium]|nr:DivIVA domain-containing protein [bacterium]